MSSDFTVQIGLGRLHLLRGDITQIQVDAIVNAANSALAGGGGVDGAIHRAGGPDIMRELDSIREREGGCPTGSAVVTGAGQLPAKYIFHAVGPRYRGGQDNERDLLASCYETCLRLAAERSLETMSFPSISTGIYGYPLDEAAEVAVDIVAGWLQNNAGSVRTVKLVQFSEHDHETYRRYASRFHAERAAQA